MSARDDAPLLRPLVHAGTGAAALALGVLPAPWHLVCAIGGLLLGWVVLPRTPWEARLRRTGEPFLGGLRTYPLAVLLLVLLLPRAEAAAAWGVLAVGDSSAALVGRRVPARPIWGHAKATWAGSGAYLLVGAAAAWGLSGGVAALATSAQGVVGGPAPGVAACLAAAGAATLIDLVPIPPDDNLPAAAAAGGILYLLRCFT